MAKQHLNDQAYLIGKNLWPYFAIYLRLSLITIIYITPSLKIHPPPHRTPKVPSNYGLRLKIQYVMIWIWLIHRWAFLGMAPLDPEIYKLEVVCISPICIHSDVTGTGNHQTLTFKKGRLLEHSNHWTVAILKFSQVHSVFPPLWEQCTVLDKDLLFSSLWGLFQCIFPNSSWLCPLESWLYFLTVLFFNMRNILYLFLYFCLSLLSNNIHLVQRASLNFEVSQFLFI